jgi:hypothetical protein
LLIKLKGYDAMTAQAFLSLATAFGLSTAAGLNAYIPLFVVALLSRITSLITLNEPYDTLSSWWVIGTLAVLLIVEMVVDKIPAVDTVNDIIQTFIRPTAGALLFASSTNVIGLHPVLAAICGVLLAGSVHAVKAGGRPVVAATTAGIGDPIVSTIEDVISFVTSLLSIVVPIAVAALLLVTVLFFVWWYSRRRRRAC